MLCFPLSVCVRRFSPVVKLGRYAAVGVDDVTQVMVAVVLLVAEHYKHVIRYFESKTTSVHFR